jgi:hypothetical protein
MAHANFCIECGERLPGKGWRARLGRRFCVHCAQRLGTLATFRPLICMAIIVVAAFCLGRYLRPAPPPLLIQRLANSPLSDAPVEFSRSAKATDSNGGTGANQKPATAVANEEGYICGARTQKGTPCKRRVHVPGERCFQHKGLPAMVPPEKLVVKPTGSK